jgi:hypothetical protein
LERQKRLIAALGVAYAFLTAASQVRIHLLLPRSVLMIYGSFWASGHAANLGLNPYALQPLTYVPTHFPAHVAEVNMNPPALLPLFQLFALFDPKWGSIAWIGVSSALFIVPALALIKHNAPHIQARQVAWLFLAPEFYTTVALGQIYTLLFALGVFAWIALDQRREVVAGVLIGVLVAMKPPFGVWPALLLLSRSYRAAGVAFGVAAVLSIAPAFLYGPDIFGKWLAAVASDNHVLVFPQEVSLNGFFRRLGLGHAGSILAGLLLLGTSYLVWKRKPDAMTASAVAIPVSLLCSPLAWIDYLLVAAPAFLARPWDLRMTLIALLLLVPARLAYASFGGTWWVLSMAGLVFIVPVASLAGVFIRRVVRADLSATVGCAPAQAEPAAS